MEEKMIIRPTEDSNIKRFCAHMMSTTDPWITLEMNFEQCLPAFEGPFKEIYIAEIDHKVAGFVVIQTTGTFKGYVQTICVSEDFRGKGIGKKLLQFCENTILQYSPNIFICVSSFNKGATKLYYDFGFKFVGELDNFVKEGFTELLLRKSVGPMLGYNPKNIEAKTENK